ncbi:ATP-grasp domain-containing protein [Limnobacter litoralis]|uniref:ATP-grasp domain-containing protein n=1 Tax=Limnobacter litoralis TaxID=481366 RepID=A0ABQ5YS21_9BURK|nr:hypothetical protein [Limnobacter litoralis]GLR26590.1 hypothetical protein GCM10007875_16800 [Limnobacter litoralis]
MIYSSAPTLWERLHSKPLFARVPVSLPQDILSFLEAVNEQTDYQLHFARPSDEVLTSFTNALAKLSAIEGETLNTNTLGFVWLMGLESGYHIEPIAYPNGDVMGSVVFLAADRIDQTALLLAILDTGFEPVMRSSSHKRASEVVEAVLQRIDSHYLGLAPFLEISTHGGDLSFAVEGLLASANSHQDNAVTWMNLSTALFSLGQRDLGLSIQSQALQMSRHYTLQCCEHSTGPVILLLMADGDLAENTPLDCLLDSGPCRIEVFYSTVDQPLPVDGVAFDVLMVGLSDTHKNRPILKAIEKSLVNFDRPVINRPQFIPNVERVKASELLQQVDGLLMPPTHEVARSVLTQFVASATGSALVGDCELPFIVRPVGSHAGRSLEKIVSREDLSGYLAEVADDSFYVSRFIDYSNSDGLYSKMRVALVDGVPYPSHLAISEHWMIHYLNAGMYESAAKRECERAFFENFHEFAARHQHALSAIYERCGLDYICIDCAETPDGQLLVFEVDHAMVVHAKDPLELFPYKQRYMKNVRVAFERFVKGLKP